MDDTITTHGIFTGITAGIGVDGIPVVTVFYARLNDGVTASRRLAIGKTLIGLYGITVIALFGLRLDNTITTAREAA